jgi:hypothetical protein
MISPFLQTVRSRWVATLVHLGLWGVLVLAISHMGGKTPEFRVIDSMTPPPPNPVPVANMQALFSAAQWPNPQALTNFSNPFFTTHFVPAPSPTPPPPTTRKVDVTYQGFYQAGDSIKHVIAKVGDLFVVAVIGAPLTTNLFVAEASLQSLLLTNHVAQTNLIPLNVKREIEVPIK